VGAVGGVGGGGGGSGGGGGGGGVVGGGGGGGRSGFTRWAGRGGLGVVGLAEKNGGTVDVGGVGVGRHGGGVSGGGGGELENVLGVKRISRRKTGFRCTGHDYQIINTSKYKKNYAG